ncbi:uncharacterized protein LOC133417714 isoform X1 [Phycodurus eques]|uniref:uncharacterized protein LOC133417714 isoform X1 n=2 Tax=Phycodurus eques TaxID=693459 RepID=UPI002ACEE319|nr:uncharacterized protein LOC133417714 isoform X1 [Phycodurus eques]
MPGSSVKQCIFCLQHVPVACKVCKLCGTQQPMKKKIQRAQEKASREWATKLRKMGNAPKLMDTARILVHKFKMVGLHPLLLYGYAKKDKVSCGYLYGLEGVTTKELEIVAAIKDLYQSLLEVIIQREKEAQTVCLMDNEGPREPAGSSLDTRVKEEDVAFPVILTPWASSSPGLTPQPSVTSPQKCGTKLCSPPKHSVIIQREKDHQTVCLVDSGRQREPVGSPLDPKVKDEDVAFPRKTCDPAPLPCTMSPSSPRPTLQHSAAAAQRFASILCSPPKQTGSTLKQCLACMQRVPVACKVCKLCGARQPMKEKIQRAQEKASKEWATKLRKTGNTPKLVDTARILVHKFKMVGLHPLFLHGYGKKNKVSCGYLHGLEGVTTKELEIVAAIKELYQSLLEVIIQREREAQTICLVDDETQREPAGLSMNTKVKKKDLTFPLTPWDLTASAMASTSPEPPPQQYARFPQKSATNHLCSPQNQTDYEFLREKNTFPFSEIITERILNESCKRMGLELLGSHMIWNNSGVEEDSMKFTALVLCSFLSVFCACM